MCIFSSEAVVEKTIVMGAETLSGTHLMGYQNQVTSKKKNVMLLPLPCVGKFTFHDTTPYKNFLTQIGMEILLDEAKSKRGGESIDFSRVGQYEVAQVPSSDVAQTLKSLDQPIQWWLPNMIEAYEFSSWLFCIMDANTSMSQQPILVEYEPGDPETMFLPMMDIHGDDKYEQQIMRNHILIIGKPNLPDSLIKSSDIENFPFPGLEFGGGSKQGMGKNGDGIIYKKQDGTYGVRYHTNFN